MSYADRSSSAQEWSSPQICGRSIAAATFMSIPIAKKSRISSVERPVACSTKRKSSANPWRVASRI